MSAALGLNRVKEEVGGDQSQALLGTRLMTPSGQGAVAQNPLVVPPPATGGAGAGALGGAGGAQRREGGAAVAAPAIAPVASMFPGFPGVGGFFNAAAFAAAAAAVFPGGIIPTTAPNNPANPMMMTSQGAMLMTPGKTTAAPSTATAAGGEAAPFSKRRKRGRAEDGQPEVKPEAGGGGGGGIGNTIGGAGGVGGSLLSKLEGNYPHQDGTGVAGGTAAAGGAVGNGLGGAPWVGGAMNVLTPNLFEGDMSNQERKERRKIRNRMSAQQHRERQRQRVDTLEDCLRQRDQEIAKLKGEVASLSDKNRRLTGLVRQLEADSCPNLDDVLNGLGDECESSLILPTLAAAASSSSSSSPPQCVGGGMKEKDQENRYAHLHASNPTSSSFPSCVPRVGPGGSGVVSVVSEADAVVDSMAVGVGEDTDGSGGGVTTDQAQSSSSESDCDDLSPLSTLGARTGGAPSTPPLSPTRDDGNASSGSGDYSSPSPPLAFSLSKANFSLRASSSSLSKGRLPVSEAAVAGLPRIPEFSVPAGVFSSTPCEAVEGEGTGAAPVGLSPDGGVAAAAAASSTAAGAGTVIPEGGLCAGLLSSGTVEGVGGGGEGGVAGGGGGGGKEEDEPMEMSGVFGTGTGAVDEDDLTMGALDPMEIDALLACADNGNFNMNSNNNNPTTTTGTTTAVGAAAAAATASPSEPDNLEMGNNSTSHSSSVQQSHVGITVEGGRGGGAPRRLGGGVAGAVLAGSLCLAGVVLNNNARAPAGGGAGGAKWAREIVPAPLSAAHAGRRVLSAVQDGKGDGDDAEEGEAVYGNATGARSWVFHPVEAEPWLWRSTSAREGKAPWRWTSALNLFRDSQMAPIDTPGRRTSTFDHNPSSSSSSSSSPASSPSAVREQDGLDGEDGGAVLEGELVEFQDFVIAGPYDGDGSGRAVETANAMGSDNADGDGGSGVGEGARVEDEGLGQQAPDPLSGKEVDLFYRSPNGHIYNNANRNGDHRAPNGFGGGGRGGDGGPGMGMRQPPRVHGEDVMAPERTSYVFCPEAHGMMSGGLIQRANQAMYDHHHPGARPFASTGGATAGGGSALARTLGLGLGRGVGEERIAFKRGSEVKVNVVNSQLRLPRINGGDGDEDGDGLGADSSGPSSLAVVRGSSGGSNGNSGLFFDASVLGEGQEGAEAFVGTGGGGVGRGVRGGGGGGRGEGIPRRWRGPAPIHIGGEESLDGIIGEEGGAANAASEGFHSRLQRSDDAEYMTMLVPPGALDWGPSSLAVQSALNATSGNGSGGEGGAWIEIDCRVLDIRLVQDVSFAP